MLNAPVSGLWTSPNPFSQAPAGSLAKADDVAFTAAGVLGSRPGFTQIEGATFGGTGSRANQIGAYGTFTLIHYENDDGSNDNAAYWPGAGTNGFIDFDGQFTPPGDNRMRFVGAARDCFFNATRGVYMLTGPANGEFRLNYTVGTGTLTLGLTLTGGTSGATGTIVSDVAGVLTLRDVTGAFEIGETISDGAGADGTATSELYRRLVEPVRAGNIQGLGVTLEDMVTGTGAWMDADTAVAYRFTICSLDAYGRVIEGPPSGRLVVRNAIEVPIGGLVRVSTTVTVTTPAKHYLTAGDVVTLAPGEANFSAGNKTVVSTPTDYTFTYTQAGSAVASTVAQVFSATRAPVVDLHFGSQLLSVNFLRLYRSEMTPTAAESPSDELFLTYETAFLSSAELSANFIEVTDTTPQSVLNVPLYTNPNSGDGALSANYQPPVCKDMCFFGSRMWFANTTNLQSLNLALIGVGSPNGLQDGDTVTLAETIYTAKTTPSGSNEFQLVSNLDPAQNIELTTQNLVQAINTATQDDIWAFYVSADNDFPGRMRLQQKEFLNASTHPSFTALSDRATCWNPQLSDGTDYVIFSDDNRHPAGLYYSKLGLPEGVPPDNFQVVESDNNEILRIFPLNYRLLVLKTSGIFFINNTEPFQIQKMSEAKLLAPDSIGLLGERLWCMTDQGIISIGDSGVTRESGPIDSDLVPLFARSILALLKTASVGVGHETARQYLSWLPETSDDDAATNAFVYSTESTGFTRYTFGVGAAFVFPATDQLLVAPTDSNVILGENRNEVATDYRDRSYSVVNRGAVDDGENSALTLVDADAVTAGDVILDDDDIAWLVLEVTGNVVTLLGSGADATFSDIDGTYVAYQGIPCAWKYNKLTDGAPATEKLFQQVTLLSRGTSPREIDVTFSSELGTETEPIQLVSLGWGDDWGDIAWGSPAPELRRIQPLPVGASNCCQLSVEMSTRQADATFQHLGIVIEDAKDTIANRG